MAFAALPVTAQQGGAVPPYTEAQVLRMFELGMLPARVVQLVSQSCLQDPVDAERIRAAARDAATANALLDLRCPSPEAVRLAPSSLTLTRGEQGSLAWQVTAANGADLSALWGSALRWRSDDPAVATVNNGVVQALAPGRTTVRVAAGEILSPPVQVTVRDRVGQVRTRTEALRVVAGRSEVVEYRLVGESGGPVEGCAEVRTDNAGVARAAPVAGAACAVRVEAVTAGQTRIRIVSGTLQTSFAVEVERPSGRVEVTVVDPLGASVPAAELVITPLSGPAQTGQTGGNGRYTTDLTSGVYRVTARAAGFLEVREISLRVEPDRSAPLAITLPTVGGWAVALGNLISNRDDSLGNLLSADDPEWVTQFFNGLAGERAGFPRVVEVKEATQTGPQSGEVVLRIEYGGSFGSDKADVRFGLSGNGGLERVMLRQRFRF